MTEFPGGTVGGVPKFNAANRKHVDSSYTEPITQDAARALLAVGEAVLEWWHDDLHNFEKAEPPWLQSMREAVVLAGTEKYPNAAPRRMSTREG